MYTIKSTSPGGMTLGHYGDFDSLDTARRIAGNVARIARRDHDSANTYTAVPTPDGVTPMVLHPKYLG